MSSTSPLTISRAARAAGVNVETIRFYERKGLITRPQRPKGQGYRIYPVATIRRIQALRQGRELGLTLEETREILRLRDQDQGDCAEVRSQAANKLALVQDKIRGLRDIEQALQRLITACPGAGSLYNCAILNYIDGTAGQEVASAPCPACSTTDRGAATMKTLTLAITGMHCDGCAQILQHVLERLDGVQMVSVSVEEAEARLLINPNVVSESQCRLAIKRAGYQVRDGLA